MAKDFTIAEARAALVELAAEIGRKAYISAGLSAVGVSTGAPKALLMAQLYPYDIMGKVVFYVYANTWRELVDDCRAKWLEHSDLHAANTIREMAVAIITITADLGECTDAALRAKFDAADVKRFGEQAVAAANQMASNGPFSITRLSGANDAEAA